MLARARHGARSSCIEWNRMMGWMKKAVLIPPVLVVGLGVKRVCIELVGW